ncbi:hypothetical protein ABH935_001902 [Catenulispora sp. GAS73]|uniref:hypothetical protein n=1 Tax=Catenulispora sp. GAS73 TaxID=3156269 RepID=UPI003514B7C0
MDAVVLEALISTAEAVQQARREHSDPMDALATYIHAVIDLRTSAVIPALLGAIDLDEPRICSSPDCGPARTARENAAVRAPPAWEPAPRDFGYS